MVELAAKVWLSEKMVELALFAGALLLIGGAIFWFWIDQKLYEWRRKMGR